MDPLSPRNRRLVFLAADRVVRSRKKGSVPANRAEIRAVLPQIIKDGLPEPEEQQLAQAIFWLTRHGLLVREAGGHRPVDLVGKKICWVHGKEEPCKSCKRSVV